MENHPANSSVSNGEDETWHTSSSSFSNKSPSTPQPRGFGNQRKNSKKLNLNSLGLYGRDKELSILLNCFDKLLTGSVERQIVLVSGSSGSGKSKLANSLKKETKKCDGIFVRGKFEIGCRSEPYSGIAGAFDEICDALLELQTTDPAKAKLICGQIRKELGNELQLLITVIPVLKKVFQIDFSTRDGNPGSISQNDEFLKQIQSSVNSSSSDMKSRFHFAFVRFIRVVSCEFDPLVIVIDDLQWSDASSLELIEVLLADRENPKLLLLGTYRSDEIDETHIFHHTLHNLKEKSGEKDLELTEIEVTNLELKDVHKIIQKLLPCEKNEKTFGLAQVCFEKTHGNAFFLLQFLSMLYDKQLLQFGVNGYSWSWNEDDIRSNTNASDNVVNLLTNKMENLSIAMIDIIRIAAFLGATFKLETLNILWKYIAINVPEAKYDETLISGLQGLREQGFIINISKIKNKYGWAHDKIHEAALAMVPKSEQFSYGRRIGEILVSTLGMTDDFDSVLFVAANLLNSGSDHLQMQEQKRLELAQLNAKASARALYVSAFESAAVYAGYGILFLPPNAWKEHYHLALDLYSYGAKAEGFLGNVEKMESYCKEVMSQEGKPIEDKFDVLNSWIDSISNRCLFSEAAELLLDTLSKFQCRFPTKPVGIGFEMVANVLQIKRTMKSRDASKLSKMQDSTRIELMKLLDKLATCFYMLGDERMPLIIFRSLNWSIKYGYCDYSSASFGTTGMMLTGVLDDIQGGSRYGEHAMALLAKNKSSISTSRTLFVVYSYLFPWTKPIRDSISPLLEAYEIGLQSGDTESACWSMQWALGFKFMMGHSLEVLESTQTIYIKQYKNLKRDQAYFCAKFMKQMYLNLMGRNNTDDTSNFTGDALTKEELDSFEENNKTLWAMYHLCYTAVLATYGHHVKHADLTLLDGYDYMIKAAIASPLNMRDVYLKGISCYAATRETGKRKYIKIARLLRAKLRKWEDMGNPNIQHYRLLLDAEACAYRGKSSRQEVISKFKTAISHAVNGGYKHDAALACERLGEYHLLSPSEEEDARKRFVQASKYWRGWHSMGKVMDLEKRYPQFFSSPMMVKIE